MAGSVTATITVVMTDLVDSTRLLRHGADAFDDIRRAHFDAVRAAIASARGVEVKSTGDGLMATFASAADAIGAATGVQQAVASLQVRDPRSPAVRVGIGCGEAVSEDGDWYGQPVIEAARLCAEAAPGQILATSVVRAVVGTRGGHDFRSLGERLLKGFDEPTGIVEVGWAPLHRSAVALPPSVDHALTGFLAGRVEELDRLRVAWKAAQAGERHAVFVAGEPGVGKTRLVAELAREAHASGATVLWGRCDEEVTLPYQPFGEAVRHWWAARAGDAHARGVDTDGLGPLLPRAERPAPALGAFGGDPEGERIRLFEAVGSLLRAEATEGPVVLVVDDAHWAATPTLLLLRHLLCDTTPLPFLAIVTYRDTDLDRTHPLAGMLADLRRLAPTERLDLAGLSAAAVLELVEAAAGHELGPDGADLAAALHAETEGNAFFLVQTLRHLAESGAVVQVDGRWTVSRPIDELGIPEGVREVVGRRLSRLSASANDVLRVGSVIGRDFDLETVDVVIDIDPDESLDAIEEAVAAHLVQEDSGRPGRFTFAHAIVRQTLLAELTAARRARLHRKVGDTLARRAGVAAAEVAFHLCEGATAGAVDAATAWSVKAMEEAWSQWAFEEGVRAGRRALQVLELVDEPAPAARASILTLLARNRQYAGDTEDAKGIADDAIDAAVEAGDAALFAEAVISRFSWARAGVPEPRAAALFAEALQRIGDSDPALRARLLMTAALERAVNEGEGAGALEQMRAAAALARECGDFPTLGSALFGQASCVSGTADVETQRAAVTELRAVADAAKRHGYDPGFDEARLAVVLSLQTGDRDEAEAAIARAAQTAALPGVGRIPAAMVAMWRGALALAEGRLDDAQAYADALLDVASFDSNYRNSWASLSFAIANARGTAADLVDVIEAAVADTPALASLRAVLIQALLAAGRDDQARAIFDELVADDLAAVPRDVVWSSCLAVLADACACFADATAADDLRRHLLPFEGQMLVVAWGVSLPGAADRFIGMLDLVRGDVDAAATRLRDAIALEEKMRLPRLAAESRRRLAGVDG